MGNKICPNVPKKKNERSILKKFLYGNNNYDMIKTWDYSDSPNTVSAEYSCKSFLPKLLVFRILGQNILFGKNS